jgi:hypothetical protein
MAVTLHNYNIVRVINNGNIVNCTVIKMCLNYALIKYKGSKYKVPYTLIDQVVGHELLLHAE